MNDETSSCHINIEISSGSYALVSSCKSSYLARHAKDRFILQSSLTLFASRSSLANPILLISLTFLCALSVSTPHCVDVRDVNNDLDAPILNEQDLWLLYDWLCERPDNSSCGQYLCLGKVNESLSLEDEGQY
ncbi:hypothetical protein BgiBS90_002492 [Biomphalaria glabrata]|nr:hypothetical protein BgiBS90_002492 [Biomphalaria glabrata]